MNTNQFAITGLRRRPAGFTLTELLVSMSVLLLIVFVGAQMMTSTTAITRTAHRYMDTDTQARVVFDRMALDFAQMLKRTDVDYYVKQQTNYNGHGLFTSRIPIVCGQT